MEPNQNVLKCDLKKSQNVVRDDFHDIIDDDMEVEIAEPTYDKSSEVEDENNVDVNLITYCVITLCL